MASNNLENNTNLVATFNEQELSILPEDERVALVEYTNKVLAQDPRRTLAPSTAVKLFQLYLQGYSVKEIHELNPTLPIGMIVHARLKYKWDDERDRHIGELLGRVKDKVLLAQLESAHYLTDVLSAIHKLNGTKIKKFLQTGDEAELCDLKIDTLTNYSKTLEMIAKLTGQEKDKKGQPINVLVSSVAAEPSKAVGQLSDGGKTKLSPDAAAKVVRALLEIEKEKKKK